MPSVTRAQSARPGPPEPTAMPNIPEQSDEFVLDPPDDTPPPEQPRPRRTQSPVEDPPQPPAPSSNPNADIATALLGITELLRTRAPKAKSKTNIKDPEPFDGKDNQKLRRFLIQCAMHFNDRPEAFEDDRDKITFAISHLQGDPFNHFAPIITQDPGSEVTQITTWYAFEDTLRTMFGPFDESGDAEQELDTLKMGHNAKVGPFLVKFTSLAGRLPPGWGEPALRHYFYNCLPERLKDDISRSPEGKPREYLRLRELAMQYDTRYWERQAEISRRDASRRVVVKTNDRPPAPVHNPRPPFPSRRDEKKPYRPQPTPQSPKPFRPNPSSAPAQKSGLDSKLDKDGKVSAKEKQYRMDNNLCMYCGGKGHRVMNCEVLAKNNAKARAVSVPPAPASGSGVGKEPSQGAEPKKD